MEENLPRFEGAITATASGDLTPGHWALDATVALGLSGMRNPLGFAMVRYLGESPCLANAWGIILALSTSMQARGVPVAGINDHAFKAFDYWRDARCTDCGGRGVSGIEQRQCSHCAGTGQRQVPDGCDAVKVGINCLIEAEQWMEGQLAARLKDSVYQPTEGKKVNLPFRDGGNDMGFSRSPRTPVRESLDS